MAKIASHAMTPNADKFPLKSHSSEASPECGRSIVRHSDSRINSHIESHIKWGADWYYVLGLALIGAYVNGAAYGFQYPGGADYNFFLPFADWLRDRSLYPGDPIREAFPHVQTFYWSVVAILSKHFATAHILFVLFLITKLIFFAAVALLVASSVRSRALCGCIVAAIALSDVLNNQTPIGGTIILDQLSEHAALALAIVLLAGVLLVQGKWQLAAIVAGLCVYVDALQLVHMLPAFVLFAVVYWREEKGQIVQGALLGAGVFAPWFMYFHKSYLSNYPADYVAVLLIHYPLHITLRWTPVLPIAEAIGLFAAAACMCVVARRATAKVESRLELLAVSYFIVMVIGIVFGWFWLTPSVGRFMFQRADSLLIPYAFLLIQIYGAELLELGVTRKSATTILLSVLAILLPLFGTLAILLLPVMILWLDPRQLVDRACAAVFGRIGRLHKFVSWVTGERLAIGLCGVAVLAGFLVAIWSLDDFSQLWTFHLPADPGDSACFDAQLWARDHTPREAAFLVPPEGCGFRVLSQRSSWGEWSDGNAMYFYPAFADTFLNRVKTLDPTPVPQGTGIIDAMVDAYKAQSWDRIRAVANENKLDYVVQSSDVKYPVEPVYANSVFSLYKSR